MELSTYSRVVKAKPMTLQGYYGNQPVTDADGDPNAKGYFIGFPGKDGNFDGEGEGGSHWDGWTSTEKFESEYPKEGMEKVSDGYHSFEELYRFRKLYNAAAFNAWAKLGKVKVAKSKKHADGEYPFGDSNIFIVMASLPTGQISNHYEMQDWDLFQVPEYDVAPEEWDGHTSLDVIDRLTAFLRGE